MSHSYAQNHIHLVFSTKNPRKAHLQRNAGAALAVHDGHLQEPRHAALRRRRHARPRTSALPLAPDMALARAITLIKSNSSKWMGEHGRYFAWQEGYGAFSVSSSSIPSVIKYIDGQEAHHRKRTYEEEFLALLKKHKHPFDPKDFLG